MKVRLFCGCRDRTGIQIQPLMIGKKWKRRNMSIHWWEDTQNMVQPYNGILSSHEKTWSTDTPTKWMNFENVTRSERDQSQKVTYCMILFIHKAQNRQICRGRKQIGVFQGMGWRRSKEWLLNRYGWRFLLGWWKCSELDRSGGWLHNIVNSLNCHWIVYFKMVKMNFMSCKVYLDKNRVE